LQIFTFFLWSRKEKYFPTVICVPNRNQQKKMFYHVKFMKRRWNAGWNASKTHFFYYFWKLTNQMCQRF